MTDTLKPTASTLEELKKIPVDQKEIDTLNDPNNLTASFAKNLYLTGAYFEKNGITDEASKEQAMTALIQQEKAKIVPNTYSYKDINVAKAESKDSIRTYGNAIASILENIITEKVMLDDISSISNFITSKDAKDLEPILKNKKRMDTIMSKLLTLSVPPSAVIFHLATLNNVAAYRDMITDLAGSEEDPLRATIVIDKYTLTAINAGRATLQLSNYFTIKNIVFSPKEKGYIFTAGYIAK
jgi:hypothetical protein